VTDTEFQNDFLLSINNTLGDMRGLMGRVEGKVDYAIQLHETCPARLGFDSLKEKTSRFKVKTDPDSPLSLAPGKRGLSKNTIILILSAALALMFGVGFAGYMFGREGAPAPKPVTLPASLQTAGQ